jgi:hypothetical protein
METRTMNQPLSKSNKNINYLSYTNSSAVSWHSNSSDQVSLAALIKNKIVPIPQGEHISPDAALPPPPADVTVAAADRAGRNRLFARDPPIGAFQHDLASALVQARAPQQGAQGHPGPFGIADRAHFPLGAFNLGAQKDPTVARALQCGHPRLGCMRLANPTYHFAAEYVEVGG